MPRIIAGSLGGRTIPGPPGRGTRPTSDRVREAIFSRLDGWDAIAGRRVLDLYAGTGALAVEALSRGARDAVLVESHGRTAQQIGRTVRELGLGGRARVLSRAAESVVRELAQAAHGDGASAGCFSLVLIDPPYDVPTGDVEQLLRDLAPALSPDAVVVVERSARSGRLAWPDGWIDDGTKEYGETVVCFGGPSDAEDADSADDADSAETAPDAAGGDRPASDTPPLDPGAAL